MLYWRNYVRNGCVMTGFHCISLSEGNVTGKKILDLKIVSMLFPNSKESQSCGILTLNGVSLVNCVGPYFFLFSSSISSNSHLRKCSASDNDMATFAYGRPFFTAGPGFLMPASRLQNDFAWTILLPSSQLLRSYVHTCTTFSTSFPSPHPPPFPSDYT